MFNPGLVDMALIAKAEAFARQAHEGQPRKGHPPRPYIVHPADVAARLQRHGADAITVAAAWLHDTVEDCGVSIEAIVEGFGQEVADVVAEVTDEPGLNKHDRAEAQVAKAPKLSRRAKLLKVSDKTSNMKDLVEFPPGWRIDSVLGYAQTATRLVLGMGDLGPEAKGLLAEFEAAVIDIDRCYGTFPRPA